MRTITLCTVLFFLTNLSSVLAQTKNTWKGGAPGHESDWNHYKNWSLGKTPDVFDRVIIPDVSASTRKYPIIKAGEFEVLSIEVQTGASLILLPAARIVAEEFACYGSCQGCEQRVLIEGTTPPDVAAHR
ncbi:MAG: hypothetical protein ACOYPR_07570 [Saprospiraceae bacterium]